MVGVETGLLKGWWVGHAEKHVGQCCRTLLQHELAPQGRYVVAATRRPGIREARANTHGEMGKLFAGRGVNECRFDPHIDPLQLEDLASLTDAALAVVARTVLVLGSIRWAEDLVQGDTAGKRPREVELLHVEVAAERDHVHAGAAVRQAVLLGVQQIPEN